MTFRVLLLVTSSLALLLVGGAGGEQPKGKPKPGKEDKAGTALFKGRGQLVYAVTTPLQRELAPHKANFVVLLDTTDALGGGGADIGGLRLPALRKALAQHKKADSRAHFTLFYRRSENDRTRQYEALRYAVLGFGVGMGFEKASAYAWHTNTDQTWAEVVEPFTKLPRQPKGDEPASVHKLAKAYPVRTELSRYFTGDADCAVVVLKSFEKEGGAIPEDVRKAVTGLVGKLKLKEKQRIWFRVSRPTTANGRS